MVVGSTKLLMIPASQLVSALRSGGFVLIMRHPDSPRVHPDASLAHSGNLMLERQLDTQACDSARAMGAAFSTLQVKLSRLLCSSAFRAREAIQVAGFGEPTVAPELDEVPSLSPGGVAPNEWLRAQTGRTPPPGTNSLLVTHLPTIVDAFENIWPALGETLVFQPANAAVGTLVARIPITDWPHLAAGPITHP